MKPEAFSIHFEPHQSVYYPGDIVLGKVDLATEKPLKVKAIYINVKGKAEVKWLDHYGSARDLCRHQTDKIFTNKYVLINFGEELEDSGELPSGDHCFPFTFTLPDSLPSSFEGKFGNVQYHVQAVVDRSWQFDQEVTESFQVCSVLDLNEKPQTKVAVNMETSQDVCSFFCIGSGSVRATTTLPKTGFAIGDFVQLRTQAENKTDRTVRAKLALQQVVTYRTKTKTKREVTPIIDDEDLGEVVANDQNVFEKSFQIPKNTLLTDLGGCKIISVSHILQVYDYMTETNNPVNYEPNFQVKLSNTGLKQEIPITIGTIPLQD